jgi:superfamily II DNA or RNA helicase
MDLFEPLVKTITMPSILSPSINVGRHRVNRFAFRFFSAEFSIKDAGFSGYYELSSDLASPFNLIYLKKWNSRGSCPEGILSLKFKSSTDVSDLCEKTPLLWVTGPDQNSGLPADELPKAWKDTFRFRAESEDRNSLGLRSPQLGALHAISAYFTTDKDLEPATVVLPTGTGKTETMLSTMVYQQCEKIMVIVPSDSLRKQITSKFLSLGYLPEMGVVPFNGAYPYVAKLETGLKSVREAADLAEASNVVVATTSILSSSNNAAVNELCKRCTHLFVDEAHHISAKSWLAIRERFLGRKVVQFTATPFRNDKKALGGRIIYNYTMGEAQRAGYFTQVKLIPVEEYYEDNADESIAIKAIETLRRDLDEGHDHLMMARVKSKLRAEALIQVYQRLAPDLDPIVVHSDYTKTLVSERLNRLVGRQSKIVVCVDMLGEGYDLANLKIAALHDHHKSLAITLQFIGRFTRVSHEESLGQASVIMNVADPEVEGDLQHLYAQGADWDSVLRRLSERRIAREVRLQEVVDSLKSNGDLHNQISLWNLEPSYTAMLFKTTCDNWRPDRFDEHFPKFDEYWHSYSDDEKLLVVLAIQTTPVKWGSYKDLRDSNYKLLIVHWDEERKALFIYSNDYKIFRVEKMAETISDGQCELLSGDQIFNVFNGIEYPLARNLGASQNGSISFTQYFGSNVTDGLSLIEESQSTLSNIAALGYEAGERVVWGCSQRKGKVWSPQKGGAISDWSIWVKNAWDKVVADGPDEGNITKNFLRPQKLEEPCEEHPVSAQWGEQLLTAFEDKVVFLFGGTEIPFYQVDIAADGKEDDGCVRIIFSAEGTRSIYKILIAKELMGKGYEYQLLEGDEVSIKKGSVEPVPLPEYMISDPVIVYYIGGSFSYNAQFVAVSDDIGLFSVDDILPYDWDGDGVNIRKESMGYGRESDTIQASCFRYIENDYDVIINDDGPGEAADLVALKATDSEILLTLVHCKFSSKDDPGARLKDLYEVCGQAQRSIRWKHLNLNYLYHHIKHRQKLWRNRGYSRFLKGGIEDLASIRNRSRTLPIRFSVVIVQPGLSIKKINEDLLNLLGSTSVYIKKTTMAELVVIGSD